MSSYTEGNDFQTILSRLLSNVSDSLDKREGSIIYDALAPAALELAQCYTTLEIYSEQTNLLTAVSTNLDKRVIECGIERLPATAAKAIIKVFDKTGTAMHVDNSTRFSTPNEAGGNVFKIIEERSVGTYLGECETLGKQGNSYFGALLPLQSINNLGEAYIDSIETQGEDEETDDSLRQRALLKLNEEAFAGNKAAYRQMTVDNPDFGVEDCKVYPVWNGGGTVKLELIGPNHTLLSQTEITNIQNAIDPSPQGTGMGLAPIGHTVTVETPTADNLTISATLELESSTDLATVTPLVVDELQKYIYEVQSNFVSKDTLVIYIAKVIAAILNVKDVKNVTDVEINSVADDYEIDNTLSDPTDVIKYPILLATGVILS